MRKFCFFLLVILLAASCRKDKPTAVQEIKGRVEIRIHHEVSGSTIEYDTMKYVNAAGFQYGVSRLQYILSAFAFDLEKEKDSVFYVDPKIAASTYVLEGLSPGDYNTLKFTLGLDSTHNIFGKLRNIKVFNEMEWPDVMGGGYHFMKMEGTFIQNDTLFGYAMHLGRNGNTVAFALPHKFSVRAGQTTRMELVMDINEWFANPSMYDFNKDGNYSMGDMEAMKKLSLNGVDIFKFKE